MRERVGREVPARREQFAHVPFRQSVTSDVADFQVEHGRPATRLEQRQRLDGHAPVSVVECQHDGALGESPAVVQLRQTSERVTAVKP